jgi:hypothetical protein
MTTAQKDDVRSQLEATYGKVWTTSELQEEFKVKGFAYGVVVVQRLSDGVMGTMEFAHMPRFYFAFQPE